MHSPISGSIICRFRVFDPGRRMLESLGPRGHRVAKDQVKEGAQRSRPRPLRPNPPQKALERKLQVPKRALLLPLANRQGVIVIVDVVAVIGIAIVIATETATATGAVLLRTATVAVAAAAVAVEMATEQLATEGWRR